MTDASVTLREGEAQFGDYFALLKPRVMSLVVFTALVGLLVAPVPMNPFVGLLRDPLHRGRGRRVGRPQHVVGRRHRRGHAPHARSARCPPARSPREEALAIGVGLSGLSVVMLALATNLVAAGLLAFTIFFYAVIYTMWLKRWTPQNIVIGGAAGAFPPMIGWVAATGSVSIEAVLMFALIFMWTPPHFWALALFMKSDYDDAGVPMLTVTHGRRATRTPRARLYGASGACGAWPRAFQRRRAGHAGDRAWR